MPRPMDTPTFIAKAVEKWGEGRFGYDKCGSWKGAKVKFEIYCCKCEEYFFQTPDKHLKGNGCKECADETRSNAHRLPASEWITKFIEIHGNKYDYSRVIGNFLNYDKIWIRCPIHGWFEQTIGVHLRGSGCKECGNESSSEKQSLTTEQCLARFREAHGDKYKYPNFEYKGWDSKILAVCPTHGPWDTTTAGSHIWGVGCPTCGKIQIGRAHV